MTSPFSCSAASSGLPRLFHMSKPSSKWGPSSPGQELLCVSRRKFANLDLLRIRHFEKFDFRSNTHGTGLILGKYQTGNHAIWLVDFLYQPSQELSRVIKPCYLSTVMLSTLQPYPTSLPLPRYFSFAHCLLFLRPLGKPLRFSDTVPVAATPSPNRSCKNCIDV